MRDVGTIEGNVTSARMSARQRGAIGETLDGKRYSIKQVAHDTIMDQLEPGAVPLGGAEEPQCYAKCALSQQVLAI